MTDFLEAYAQAREQAYDMIYFMQRAYEAATYSPDPSTQNGAILIGDDGYAIGVGFNNFPKGIDPAHWTDREAKYARVVHAEVAAVLHAARMGRSTRGSTLICPWAACSNCAKHVAAAGVKRLVRHVWDEQETPERWKAECDLGDEIMREAGIEIVEIHPIRCGINVLRDGKPLSSIL